MSQRGSLGISGSGGELFADGNTVFCAELGYGPGGMATVNVSNPASPNYRHFLTPKEFTAKFGPTQAQYNEVLRFARQHRLGSGLSQVMLQGGKRKHQALRSLDENRHQLGKRRRLARVLLFARHLFFHLS